MGACASFPRGPKPAEAGEAPAPEPAPELSFKGANFESTDDVKLEHDKKDDEAEQPSLGSFLDENGKKANEEVAANPKEEEQKPEAPTTPNKTDEDKDSMEKNEKEGKKDY